MWHILEPWQPLWIFSQLFEELESLSLKLKQFTPKSNTGAYSDTKLSRFGLAGFSMVPILYFKMFISQPFEQLQGCNLEFKLITPKSITETHIWTIEVILDFFKQFYLTYLKSYSAEV